MTVPVNKVFCHAYRLTLTGGTRPEHAHSYIETLINLLYFDSGRQVTQITAVKTVNTSLNRLVAKFQIEEIYHRVSSQLIIRPRDWVLR